MFEIKLPRLLLREVDFQRLLVHRDDNDGVVIPRLVVNGHLDLCIADIGYWIPVDILQFNKKAAVVLPVDLDVHLLLSAVG